MLKHHLVIQLQAGFNIVDGCRLSFELELHVVAVTLLGVIAVSKLSAAEAIDLLKSGATGLKFLGDATHHFLDAFFLSLHFQDIDSFVLTFHELYLIDNPTFMFRCLPFFRSAG